MINIFIHVLFIRKDNTNNRTHYKTFDICLLVYSLKIPGKMFDGLTRGLFSFS